MELFARFQRPEDSIGTEEIDRDILDILNPSRIEDEQRYRSSFVDDESSRVRVIAIRFAFESRRQCGNSSNSSLSAVPQLRGEIYERERWRDQHSRRR